MSEKFDSEISTPVENIATFSYAAGYVQGRIDGNLEGRAELLLEQAARLHRNVENYLERWKSVPQSTTKSV